MHDMLQTIIQKKHTDLKIFQKRDFYSLFLSKGKMVLIGEVKFASPSNQHISFDSNITERVRAYEKARIDALSVITEKHFFKGDSVFIAEVKRNTSLPVLQKDFIVDSSQIYEAKALGSDALLLIARIVNTKTLKRFVLLCQKLDIEPVIEVVSDKDLQKALATKARIIAVNARDLDTFTVNVAKACLLIKKIPPSYIRLGFSGIFSQKEVLQYRNARAQGILIGTALMQAKNVESFVKRLSL